MEHQDIITNMNTSRNHGVCNWGIASYLHHAPMCTKVINFTICTNKRSI
ncbi:MAG: hypothetical protein IPN89_14720 [Saprospiraceae bacterium]|nr:hypothetical protein [Saprospiraceae bacterium]